jgi:polysaccharide lyase-like protein
MPEVTLFEDGFESGNFSKWDIVSSSGFPGTYNYSVQKSIVHTGIYAAKLVVQPIHIGATPGVRLGYHAESIANPTDPKNLPDLLFAEAWYFLPTYVETTWDNIMQVKQARIDGEDQTRDPVTSNRLIGKDNSLILQLKNHVDESGQYFAEGIVLAESTVSVPIAEWFSLRWRYLWSQDLLGEATVWVNNTEMYNVSGFRSEFNRPFLSFPRQITFNNYAAQVKPSKFGLFIDDVRVWTESE